MAIKRWLTWTSQCPFFFFHDLLNLNFHLSLFYESKVLPQKQMFVLKTNLKSFYEVIERLVMWESQRQFFFFHYLLNLNFQPLCFMNQKYFCRNRYLCSKRIKKCFYCNEKVSNMGVVMPIFLFSLLTLSELSTSFVSWINSASEGTDVSGQNELKSVSIAIKKWVIWAS